MPISDRSSMAKMFPPKKRRLSNPFSSRILAQWDNPPSFNQDTNSEEGVLTGEVGEVGYEWSPMTPVMSCRSESI